MDSTALKSLAKAVISTEAKAIASLENRIDDSFVAACEIILACRGRVVVLGMGKSGHRVRALPLSLYIRQKHPMVILA